MAYHPQQRSEGGSSRQPPSYRPQSQYRGEQHFYEEQDDYQRRRSHLMPNSIDSNRAIATSRYGYGTAPPETPSAYSDPYEYNSTIAGHHANVISTRPEGGYLAYDPYDRQPLHEEDEPAELHRSNTLLPGDSISAYEVNAISRNLNIHERGASQDSAFKHSYHYRKASESREYNDGSYAYGLSSDEVPLRNYPTKMGYADDEYEEQYQRNMNWNGYSSDEKHAPSLFANNQHAMPPDELEKEDHTGLLANLSPSYRKGPKPGWGGTLEEQIARRRKGIGRQRWPVLTWLLTIAYIGVFIAELIQAKQKTGQAIQTTPSWNPMLGPSFEFLISYGARFVPCMRKVPDIPTTTQMACLQYSTLSSLTSDQMCPIWQICGLPNANTTNQAYRFVAPIFVHAGFVHILFNLMVQLTLCAQIEILISTPFYALIYFAGGIGGNLLGGNFGLVGQPSVGASGAIYTCISAELVDLCYNWKYEYKPKTRLIVSICFAVIGFAIGLIPGLDNFAHIGGFAVGTLGGLLFCPAIHATKKHRIITWILRVISAGLLVGFCESFLRDLVAASLILSSSVVALTLNFYNSDDPSTACEWCKYLSW
jgi:membrane associated rhomboid family serine protease